VRSIQRIICALLVCASCSSHYVQRITIAPAPRLAQLDARTHRWSGWAAIEQANERKVRDAAFVIGVAKGVESARVRQSVQTIGRASVSVPRSARADSAGFVNGHPCGGDLPSCCTLRIESGGRNVANFGGAPYYGYWQFGIGTWGDAFGIHNPLDATAAQQDERARQVFDHGRGASNWYGDGCYNGR
jgi:hypothetical protein